MAAAYDDWREPPKLPGSIWSQLHPYRKLTSCIPVGLVRCQHVFITNLCNYHPWHSKLLKAGQSAHGMGSKQPIAFIPRQREEKNVWYVLLSPRRINNTHTTYLNGFRGSCEIHPPLQLTVAKRPKRLRQVAGTCKMMVVGRFATKPPAFCMVLLMLCTLLLMTESLSAVPHGNEQTIGENIAGKPAWTLPWKQDYICACMHAN